MRPFDRFEHPFQHYHPGHDRTAGEVAWQAGMVVWNRELHRAENPCGAKA
jgi:hypothetical protein